MEPMQTALTYRRVVRDLAAADLLRNRKAAPSQILDIGEMEMLETAVANGRSALELLTAKVSSDDTTVLPFKNFCAYREEAWTNQHNPHLAERFRQVSAQVERYTRSRARR